MDTNHPYYRGIFDAYSNFKKKNWNKIYIALDIHGTCADADYKHVSKKLYENSIEPLKKLSNFPEVSIILYSCCHKKDQEEYIKLFTDNGIKIDYFNENPEVPNTETGCFDIKFYYNLIIEDKGFFNKDDWEMFIEMYEHVRKIFV